MHWILQENMFQEAEWLNIIQTLEKLELPFSVHKVVPFVGELDPPVALDTTNVICMGVVFNAPFCPPKRLVSWCV